MNKISGYEPEVIGLSPIRSTKTCLNAFRATEIKKEGVGSLVLKIIDLDACFDVPRAKIET